MRIAIFCAHTDDGELGMGATMHRFIREEHDVHYVAFSIADISLPSNYPAGQLLIEMNMALDVLGLPKSNRHVYDFETRYFSDRRQDVLQHMVNFKKVYNPDVVFCPSLNDYHQDHKVIAEEVVRCFKTKSILMYELSWNNHAFRSDTYFEVTDDDITAKLNALSCYKTQARKDYMIRKEMYFRGLAVKHGVEMGFKYAEAFEQVRSVVPTNTKFVI